MISPLHGKRIVIIRALKEAGALRRKLAELGATVYCTPALDFAIHQLNRTESALLSEPKKFQGLIFGSRHAVRYWLEQIRAQGGTELLQTWLNGSHHLAAVGAKTASTLRRICHRSVLFPRSGIGANALLAVIGQKWHPQAIASILLPVAKGEGDDIQVGLKQLGHTVTQLPCYQTRSSPPECIDLTPWHQGKVDALLFYSPSAVEAYFDALQQESNPQLILSSQVFVIGEKTYNTCKFLGFKNVVETRVTNLRDCVNSLEQTLRYEASANPG